MATAENISERWGRTVEDPLLVREDADVLSQRLSQRYGHLIRFPVLMARRREGEAP